MMDRRNSPYLLHRIRRGAHTSQHHSLEAALLGQEVCLNIAYVVW